MHYSLVPLRPCFLSYCKMIHSTCFFCSIFWAHLWPFFQRWHRRWTILVWWCEADWSRISWIKVFKFWWHGTPVVLYSRLVYPFPFSLDVKSHCSSSQHIATKSISWRHLNRCCLLNSDYQNSSSFFLLIFFFILKSMKFFILSLRYLCLLVFHSCILLWQIQEANVWACYEAISRGWWWQWGIVFAYIAI